MPKTPEEIEMYREEILKLFVEGKTRREISEILDCAYSMVVYHVGKSLRSDEEQTKHLAKCQVRRSNLHPYTRKLERFFKVKKQRSGGFKTSPEYIAIRHKIHAFCNYKENGEKIVTNEEDKFTVEDVINKFGENPKCYLTGTSINIMKPESYQFDHIVPKSRGGDNNIENLGISTRDANISKNDLLVPEYIELCISVLKNFGYTVVSPIKDQ